MGAGVARVQRRQNPHSALRRTPSLRRLRPLAACSFRPKQDALRSQTLFQKDLVGLVAVKRPARTRVRIDTARQSDLLRGLKDVQQLAPIGLPQSRRQGGMLRCPLTGGAGAQRRSIRPGVNRRAIRHTKLIRVGILRSTLEGQRDLRSTLVDLLPRPFSGHIYRARI